MAKRRRKSRRGSRRRGKNAWRVTRGSGRAIALKYFKKRRKSRKGKRKAGRRKAKRNRRYNKSHRRRNPSLSLSKPLAAITAGYNLNTITRAGVITAGVLGNAWLSGMLSGLGFLPSFLKRGIGSYAVGLGSAGLLGAGTAMLSPKYAGEVFFGGVLGEVTRAVKEYVLPNIPGMRGYFGDFSDFGDYLTPQNAASAMPLGYFGDYLTPQNAAQALPLHGFSGDDAISEELAVFA